MKNLCKIFFINCLLITIILFIGEFFCSLRDYSVRFKGESVYSVNHYIKFLKNKYLENKYFDVSEPRNTHDNAYNQNSGEIILLGCSYTYGRWLNEKDTFSYQLQENSKRRVYNYALIGGSPREMLYLLRKNIYQVQNPNNIEYVIYTYINDHKLRLYYDLRTMVPKYLITNDKQHLEYKEEKYFYKKCFLYKYIVGKIYYAFFLNKGDFELFSLYMKEINREIQRKYMYKNNKTKFVILIYQDDYNEDWTQLEKDGFIVLNAKKLCNVNFARNKEYQVPVDDHPNARAWELIVPALVKELNL